MTDRTYRAWQTLTELEPTPRARKRSHRAFMLAVLSALTVGYLLAVAPWLGIVFLLAIPLIMKEMK